MGVVGGVVHGLVDWALNFLRVATLLALAPLLIPALLLRWVGSGTSSVLLTAAILPFAAAWLAIKAGFHFVRSLTVALLSLPYTIAVTPYRVMRFLTKKHDSGVARITP